MSAFPLTTRACGCWTGVGLNDFAGDRANVFVDRDDDTMDWCVHLNPLGLGVDPPSSSDRTRKRLVTVDPLISSCLVIISDSSSSSSSPVELQYSLVMPTVGSALSPLLQSVGAAWSLIVTETTGLCWDPQHLQKDSTVYSSAKDLLSWVYSYLHYVSSPLLAAPLYPALWLLATGLLSIEHDLAASPVVKYAAAAFLGLFFAFLWVAILLYR